MNKNACLLVLTLFSLSACSSPQSDTAALKKALLKTNEELLNKGNLAYADEAFSADYAGRGPGQIKLFIRELRTAFPDLKVKVEPIIAEGNMVAWRREHTGTHKGAYMGFQPSNKTLQWTAIIMSQYEDGKVVEEWGEDNLLEVLEAHKEMK